MQHHDFMQLALKQAKLAASKHEVPIGAVIVKDNTVVAQAYNRTLSNNDPTAHAEILCIQMAAKALGNHRLNGCSLYVTLEPCVMCLGAISEARLDTIYYGCTHLRTGALSKGLSSKDLNLNWHTHHEGGLLADASKELLDTFFKARRQSE